ncbi:hypothetical protein [Deinococcus ruber]|uniref:Uncharacterized protein n=1 Tax=Deinococcus ruber TaxID=1848197 RepID=A0A918C706_9DEIO|nr:hypothetical protein [Deinococcus ruber]GGR09896.1 hypothetical protein GCM10008957_23330 [Deinococcus ruber]
MMQRTVMVRARILDEIQASPHRVVLIYGPLAYGKSVVMRQLAEVLSDRVRCIAESGMSSEQILASVTKAAGAETLTAIPLPPSGTLTVLIEQAYLLDQAVMAQLLSLMLQGPKHLHWVVELRSLRIPGLQMVMGSLLIVGPEELRFQADELLAWQPQLAGQLKKLSDDFGGWPFVAAHATLPIFDEDELFQDLIATLPPDLQGALRTLQTGADWETFSARHPAWVVTLLQAGLPVFEQRRVLVPLPALQTFLQQLPPQTYGSFDQMYLVLQSTFHEKGALAVVPLLSVIEWDTLTRAQRHLLITLTQDIPLSILPSGVLDGLAYTAAQSGHLERATQMAQWQIDQRQATFGSFEALMIVAEHRQNTFPRYMEYLQRCQQLAHTTRDHFRVHIQQAYAHHMKQEAKQMLVSVREARKYTEELVHRKVVCEQFEVLAYSQLSDMQGIERAYKRASALMESRSTPEFRDMQSWVAESFKDAGRYREGLRILDEAYPEVAPGDSSASSAFGTFNRALLHMELGEYTQALIYMQQARERLERAQRKMSLIMPLTFTVWLLWRTHAELAIIEQAVDELRRSVAEYWSSPWQESEAASFLPVAEGVLAMAQHQPQRALEHFSAVRTKNAEMYDTVLLAWIMVCQLHYDAGSLERGHLEQLLSFSQSRLTGNDAALAMYGVRHHRQLLEFCAEQGWETSRLQTALLRGSVRVLQLNELQVEESVWQDGGLLKLTPFERVTLAYLFSQQRAVAVTPEQLKRDLFQAWGLGTIKSHLSHLRAKLRRDAPEVLPLLTGQRRSSLQVAVQSDLLPSSQELPLSVHLRHLRALDAYEKLEGEWIREVRERIAHQARQAVTRLPSSQQLRGRLELLLLLPDDPQVMQSLLSLPSPPGWLIDLLERLNQKPKYRTELLAAALVDAEKFSYQQP